MVGSKVRKIRQEKGLTLNQIAEATNLTASYISQVERDIIEPSISSLRKIANVLRVPIYIFFGDDNEERIFIKANERKKMKLPNSNIFYEFLTPMPYEIDGNVRILSAYFEINPKSSASDDFFVHKADEMMMVLEGCLEIILGEQSYILEKGDCIYVKEGVPHKMINNGDSTVKGLFSISPPIY
ncbi:XRE family transcriptional regulator [Proteiniborus sp.]|uniref:helix-turn-helix domain-containing protein n=1 Tax=Proteiniborus sp. TaxID=2079015 RepID=UPI0033210591